MITFEQSTYPNQSPVSEKESYWYYTGLPSRPRLVARSSTPTTPWREPAYPVRKELKSVGNHTLNDIWEDKLAPLVLDILDSERVKFTSVDVVRIGVVGKPSPPVILWIGVLTESLTPVDGLNVALRCKELLEKNNIADVDVELRESIVTRSVGPRFLDPVAYGRNPTVEACRPLTATLGLAICAQSTSWAEGTGGFYMAEGGDSKRILLVTARHVVFPPNIVDNNMYEHENPSQPRRNVLLLGDGAFKELLAFIQSENGNATFMADYQPRRLEAIKGMDVEADEREREREVAQATLDKANKTMNVHRAFCREVLECWGPTEGRVLGHVLFAPPIGVGPTADQYTEDFAVIALDPSKIDAQNFKGNVIDLGSKLEDVDLCDMMNPHPTNLKRFEYPPDHLLTLQGTISTAELRCPTMVDQNGKPCLMVLKQGTATDLTIGRGNNVFSFVRHYFRGKEPQTSKEWPVLPYNQKSGAFSGQGDSGAVVVDVRGRIGGLITSGCGDTDDLDITYATPMDFLMQRIAKQFPNAHLNPVVSA